MLMHPSVGFGTILSRPWVVESRVEPRPVVTVSLTADHRVRDGHTGARLLNAIERLLQDAGETMSESEPKSLIAEILGDIAPEADLSTVAGDEDLRDTLDLDSMDFMNFVVALHQRTGIDIPEADYPELRTLDGVIAYLARRIAQPQSPPATAP